MRDKFVGDIGDYGKYGLLRALCGLREGDSGEELSLGIVWCWVPDQGIRYLNDPAQFERCDPLLFAALSEIVKDPKRSVESIEKSQIFRNQAVFFREPVNGRLEDREMWRRRAFEETANCRLVFFDPDNGLKSGPAGDGSGSSVYLYSADLKPFVARHQGQSLVVYHHLGRPEEGVANHVKWLADDLRVSLELNGEIWVLLHRRYTLRAYFIIPSLRDRDVLEQRIAQFLRGPWGQRRSRSLHAHFERVEL